MLCDAYAVLPGWAAHTGHVAIVLSGVVCAAIFFEGAKQLRDVFLYVAMFAAALAGAGWLLHQYYPVSKIGATPPWALYCAAICVAAYAALYWLIEVRGRRRWTALVEPAASSPLHVRAGVFGCRINAGGGPEPLQLPAQAVRLSVLILCISLCISARHCCG